MLKARSKTAGDAIKEQSLITR